MLLFKTSINLKLTLPYKLKKLFDWSVRHENDIFNLVKKKNSEEPKLNFMPTEIDYLQVGVQSRHEMAFVHFSMGLRTITLPTNIRTLGRIPKSMMEVAYFIILSNLLNEFVWGKRNTCECFFIKI